jgi:hypothetical protein
MAPAIVLDTPSSLPKAVESLVSSIASALFVRRRFGGHSEERFLREYF